jgi:hypothetical protein
MGAGTAPLDPLTPSALWSELDADTRLLAAQSLYRDPSARREADLAIAVALRFREAAVRKLPVQQRLSYLLRAVRADDSLAASLLLALHLAHRRPLLQAFLERLGIPQREGLIDAEYALEPFGKAELAAPVAELFERFPAGEVELYLRSLLALDPGVWSALGELLGARAGR